MVPRTLRAISATAVCALMAMAIEYVTVPQAARIIPGVLMVFFLPGFATVRAVLPASGYVQRRAATCQSRRQYGYYSMHISTARRDGRALAEVGCGRARRPHACRHVFSPCFENVVIGAALRIWTNDIASTSCPVGLGRIDVASHNSTARGRG